MPPEGNVQPSLLDRLIDLEPARSEEAPLTAAQSLRQLKAAIQRDLEWLLNTRCTYSVPGDEFEAVRNSVYMFGIPDFSAYTMGSSQMKSQLLRSIRSAVEIFEPRISHLEVSQLEGTGDKENRHVRFVISGLVEADPAPAQVAFDTRLELASGEYRVRPET